MFCFFLRTIFLVLLFLFCFISFLEAKSEPSLKVVINEIAWMGTLKSSYHEWIELYNNSSFSITLDGWQLVAEDGNPKIFLKGIIPKKGFFLLERSNEKTLPYIKADLIYKGSLNNKGEHLKLIAKNREIVDEINCSKGWFKGDNKTKKTMERKNSLISGNNPENWQTSEKSGGTPKEKNSSPKNFSNYFYQNQKKNFSFKKERKSLDLSQNSFLLFLIALGISICSAIFVLILKKYSTF